MASVQIDTKYTLEGPDGTIATFNDPTDPNYIGVLTEVAGLDSPEVRESADDLVQMDGGIHGDFYYGRRPVTLNGVILNPASAAERNARQNRLMQASNAMRGDATLRWTPDGGEEQYIKVRRQQPLRIEGNWQKTFQLAVVAADPRVYSWAENMQSVQAGAVGGGGFTFPMAFPLNFGATPAQGQVLANNEGNTETFPTYVIYGPITNPTIMNLTTGKNISLIYTLGSNDALVVDTLNRQVLLAARSGADAMYNELINPSFDLTTTNWTARNPETLSVFAVDSGWSASGSASVRYTASTTTFGVFGFHSASGNGNRIPVVGDAQYELRMTANVLNALATDGLKLMITWYNASNGVIRQDSSAWYPGTGIKDMQLISTSPGAAVSAYVEIYGFEAAPESLDMYVDKAFFSKAVGATYFDGDTSGAVWEGASHASRSIMLGEDLAASMNSRYSAVDFLNTEWGGLIPGVNDIRVAAATLASGSKLRVEWRDAWL